MGDAWTNPDSGVAASIIMQQADLLARAHRSGFYRLSQIQLKHLLADTSERHGPDMDPDVCSRCSQWIRRCKCDSTNNLSSDVELVAGGLIGLLPTELAMQVMLALPLSSLGALAAVSKFLRMAVYTEELWGVVRAMAPWAPQAAECRPRSTSARLAMRQEAMTEASWSTGRWTAATVPLERLVRRFSLRAACASPKSN